jgi:hypothetical protein
MQNNSLSTPRHESLARMRLQWQASGWSPSRVKTSSPSQFALGWSALEPLTQTMSPQGEAQEEVSQVEGFAPVPS